MKKRCRKIIKPFLLVLFLFLFVFYGVFPIAAEEASSPSVRSAGPASSPVLVPYVSLYMEVSDGSTVLTYPLDDPQFTSDRALLGMVYRDATSDYGFASFMPYGYSSDYSHVKYRVGFEPGQSMSSDAIYIVKADDFYVYLGDPSASGDMLSAYNIGFIISDAWTISSPSTNSSYSWECNFTYSLAGSDDRHEVSIDSPESTVFNLLECMVDLVPDMQPGSLFFISDFSFSITLRDLTSPFLYFRCSTQSASDALNLRRIDLGHSQYMDVIMPEAAFQDYTGWIGTAVGGFLDLNILPGVSFGGLMFVLLAFLFVMYFLKLFAGG